MNEPQPQANQNPDNEDLEIDASASARAKIAEKSAQIVELKDRLLRAVAETENTLRRAQKEREDTAKYAVGNFAKEMLAVADNFTRALEARPKEGVNPATKNLLEGIEATSRQLQAAFERFGIKK